MTYIAAWAIVATGVGCWPVWAMEKSVKGKSCLRFTGGMTVILVLLCSTDVFNTG